jgi:OOP family OmpA-OmpF porin
MKKIVLAAVCFGLLNLSTAQAQDDNLVENPSFDETEGKLKKLGQIDVAKGWSSATQGEASLFSADSRNELIGIPDNEYGRQKTDDGEYYAGLVFYAYQNKSPRSYITTELLSTLTEGGKYCVKYQVTLSDLSKYGCNNLGMQFTKKKVGMDNENHLLMENPLMRSKNTVITEMDIWTNVCNVYEAEGGEQYLTIGNFKTNEATDYKKVKRPKGFSSAQKAVAYYYIENVEVTMIDAYDECECEKKNPYAQAASVVYSSQLISEADLTPEEVVENVNCYFDFIKDDLAPAGIRDLNILTKTLVANPEMKITIQGHVDLREKEKAAATGFYGDTDQKRAQKCVDYLVGKGVAADRLTIETVGDTLPVETSGTELAKAKNRRVEFILK